MLDLLNHGWVGSLIGILGLLVGALGLVLYLRSRIGGRPVCQMTSFGLIAKKEQELPHEVRILYHDREVPRLAATKIWFWNDGTQTISGNQIVQDDALAFAFDKGDEILRADVDRVTRPTNKFAITVMPKAKHRAVVTFDFLDPGDGAKIELLHTSTNLYPKVIGTIRGIPAGVRLLPHAVTRSTPRIPVRRLERILYGTSLVLGVLLLILAALPDSWLSLLVSDSAKDPTRSYKLFRIVVFVGGLLYTGSASGLLYARRRRYPSVLEDQETAAKPDDKK